MPNPILNKKTFSNEQAYSSSEMTAGWAAGGVATADAPARVETAPKTMTINGTIAKTLVLMALLIAAAGFGWSMIDIPAAGQVSLSGAAGVWLFGSMIAALVLGLVTAFAPKAAPFTAPLYAIAEGILVGAISAIYNARWNGIVLQAVAATIGVFLVMLVLYTSRAIRVTPKLQRGIIAATVGVLLAYLGIFIASLFTNSIEMFSSGPIGIIFSFIVAGVAAFNLLLDFSFVEQGSTAGAPKRYEWYCGFGLLVTLVWLYLSILRLLGAARG